MTIIGDLDGVLTPGSARALSTGATLIAVANPDADQEERPTEELSNKRSCLITTIGRILYTRNESLRWYIALDGPEG